MTRLALLGGDDALRDELVGVLRTLPALDLLPGRSGDGADLLLVAGDDTLTGRDRCRAHAAAAPCILVVDDPSDAEAVREAMAAGARAVVGRPLGAFQLGQAADAARSFAPVRVPSERPRGRVVAVTGGAGGVGVTTLTTALAAVLEGPVAVLDLDPAGGVVAVRLAVDGDGTPGLAGEDSGRRAFERLARPHAHGPVVPSSPWPELAWTVRTGVAGELVEAAAAACASVLVDAGRGVGPALEALLAADVVVLVTRPGTVGTSAALRHHEYLVRIGVAPPRIRLCRNVCSRRDVVAGRLVPGPLGPAVVVPHDEDLADGHLADGMRRRLEQLVSGTPVATP